MDLFPVHLPNIISIDWFTPISTTYALIVVAEMGDKSQIVCMTLAARHRAKPVILGAIAAFALLNYTGSIVRCRHCRRAMLPHEIQGLLSP